MDRGIVREQIAYYKAVAPEYRRFDPATGLLEIGGEFVRAPDLSHIREILRKLGPFQQILELAPGTGDWTQELARIGGRVTAIDVGDDRNQ